MSENKKKIAKEIRDKKEKEFNKRLNIEILEKLGEGGYGVVYLIKMLKNPKQLLAEKCMLTLNQGDNNKLENLFKLKEIYTNFLINLKHANIAKTFMKFNEKYDNCIFTSIIMERCLYKDLALFFRFTFDPCFYHSVNKTKEFPWLYYGSESNLSYIILQISKGLEFLHSSGFVHCDLKPENILINGDFVLKISDFDTASEAKKYAFIKIFNQSSLFCNGPESFPDYYLKDKLNEKDAFKVDIYGLGQIIFFYIFQYYSIKFLDKSKEKINSKDICDLIDKAYDKINNCKHISDELKLLVKSMICKDIKKRIDIHEVLNSKWINSFTDNVNYIKDVTNGDIRKYVLENQKVDKLFQIKGKKISEGINVLKKSKKIKKIYIDNKQKQKKLSYINVNKILNNSINIKYSCLNMQF